ncbi:hypothetical protein CWB41_12325 [Methylovirgula ligni]|uniref:Uncharacterized protein n=1 Tax=Methylovirgula ligni TaxID=569860 RepID=A0A3D9YTN5_9HYPH|nr:hypothetical protein [Methylovirgula ligni]QAY96419.1 hypothetical protein CWB41_12325 [Methylovirgula ligni]REF85854.1 hypothetical protein DES32_1890 [Methylovirgula ligni]
MNKKKLDKLLSEILTSPWASELYEDGWPYWIQGQQHAKPSKWSHEAERDRNELVRRLRRPAIRCDETEKLAAKLEACSSIDRCLSGACPVCGRAAQKLFVKLTHALLRSDQRIYSTISIVPRKGRFTLPSTKQDLFRRIRKAIEFACDDAGIDVLIGGFDPGVNEHINGAFAPHGQTQLWALGPQLQMISAEKILRKAFPAKGANRRTVRIEEFDGQLNGIAYALKSDFFRRVSIPKARDDDGNVLRRRDTRNRDLRVSQQCDLALALDRAGLGSRLFLRGAEIQMEDAEPRLTLVTRARTARMTKARDRPPS